MKIILNMLILALTTSSLYCQNIKSFKAENGKYGYKNSSGEIVIEPIYDYAGLFYQGMSNVELNKKHGFYNSEGKLVIPLIYDDAQIFRNGWSIVKYNGFYGTIDKNGEIQIPFKFTYLYDKNSLETFGLMAVGLNGKYGFVDKKGEIVIPIIYDDVNNFYSNHGLCFFKLNGKAGYFNTKGEVVIPTTYTYLESSINGDLIVAKMGDKYGALHVSGKEIIPFKFESIKVDFLSKIVMVRFNGKYQLLSQEGTEITSLKYDGIESMNTGTYKGEAFFAVAKLNESKRKVFGVVNMKGEEITKIKFEYFSNFKDGFAAMNFNGKWGYINTKGEEVIPFIYEKAEGFYQGKAFVRLNNQDFYIDETGKRIIENENKYAGDFSGVFKNKFQRIVNYDKQLWGIAYYKDLQNEFVPPMYSYIGSNVLWDQLIVFNNGCKKTDYSDDIIGGKYGFLDINGKEIIPAKYDWVQEIYNGYSPVVAQDVKQEKDWQEFEMIHTFGGKWGAIGKNGKEIIPLIYTHVIAIPVEKNGVPSYLFACCKGGEWKKTKMFDYETYDNYFVIDGTWGVLDENGQQILDFIYTKIEFEDNEIILNQNNKSYVYDVKTGKINEKMK